MGPFGPRRHRHLRPGRRFARPHARAPSGHRAARQISRGPLAPRPVWGRSTGGAIFSIDAGSAQTTTSGLVHNIAGNISFFCFPPAAILLSVGMGKDERWRALKRPALALALIVLVEAILVMVSANVVGGFGIAQRLFLFTTVLWMLLGRSGFATRLEAATLGDARRCTNRRVRQSRLFTRLRGR